MPLKQLTIATRKSPLALAQSNIVKTQLLKADPTLTITLLPMQTTGDKFLSSSLSKIGGKGLFVKELEKALLDKSADIAVHSMKDVPSELPPGLTLNSILPREDVRDAYISDHGIAMTQLPVGAHIGTSSLRRAAQIKALRPDFNVSSLRGNINTRLNKLTDFDAIILAHAGLLRMGFDNHVTELFATTDMLPAAGQGALGIESRNEPEIADLLTKLHCPITSRCVRLEREVVKALNGSCQVPMAVYAETHNHTITLSGLVGTTDGKRILKSIKKSSIDSCETLSQQVVDDLTEQGATEIIQQYLNQSN